MEHESSKGNRDAAGTEANTDESSNEAEELLVKKLTEEEPIGPNAEEEAVKRLLPRWEIRIQADRDPIAEETKAYRAIAHEVDNRYDK